MRDGLVFELAEFAANAVEVGTSHEVTADVKRRMLDVLGNGLAARGDAAANAAFAMVQEDAGAAQSTVLGGSQRLPAASAALVNGTLAHALDFDDTHLPSVLHPSASVIPAALAVGESVAASGRAVLTAAAVGDEICVRLGMAAYDPEIKNSIFFENGLHATSICGTLGSAAAVAMLLGLDAEGIAHAIAIAASMGAGLLEANRTGGSVKRIHCGWAAHASINAASLAQRGLTGPPTVLEGRFGFYRAYSEGRFSARALAHGLGDHWELLRVFYKPYPSNHFTHAGIDAALALKARGVDSSQIRTIDLGVPAPALRTIAEPKERKAHPSTPHQARFSGPFTVATAFVGGGGLGVYTDDFTDETIRDPERLRLSELVQCHADDEATEAFPHQFPAVVTVGLKDGSFLEERVKYNRGGPENPLSAEDLTTKFRLNAGHYLARDRVGQLESSLERLEQADTVRELLSFTQLDDAEPYAREGRE